MAASITIFSNYTPNAEGGEFIFPAANSNPDIFNLKLLEYYKEQGANSIFEGVTFRIYENYIDIGNPRAIEDGNITYLAITFDERILFYFVDSIQVINTGLRLYTRLDLWSTYIGRARIDNLKFTRTNVKLIFKEPSPFTIPEPLYFTEELKIDLGQRDFLGAFNGRPRGRGITRNSLRVYATIKHKTYTDISTAIDEIHTYEFNPADIATNPAAITQKDIQNLIALVSSIYAVTNNGEGNAEVMHLYIYQAGLRKNTSAVKFKGVLNGNKTDIDAFELRPDVSEYRISLYNTSTADTPPANTVKLEWLGRVIYFGTKYNGIKLPYFVGEFTIRFVVMTNNDGLIFTVMAGEEQRDITRSFEVTIVANTGTLTSQESAAKWLGVIANTAGGTFQIAAGGAGYVSGAAQIANAFIGLPNNNNGTYIGGGDGLTTFDDIINNESDYLWLCIYRTTVSNLYAENLIKANGAQCEYIWNNPKANLMEFLTDLPSLIGGDISSHVVACECSVKNIPYAAAQYIKDKLAEGLRLIKV